MYTTSEDTITSMIFIIFALAMLLFFFAILAIGRWQIFKKAGYKGWEALIPFYSDYILQSIAFGKEKGIYFLIMFLPFVGSIYEYYLYFSVAKAFGQSDLFAIVHLFCEPFTNYYLGFSKKVTYQGQREFFIK